VENGIVSEVLGYDGDADIPKIGEKFEPYDTSSMDAAGSSTCYQKASLEVDVEPVITWSQYLIENDPAAYQYYVATGNATVANELIEDYDEEEEEEE